VAGNEWPAVVVCDAGPVIHLDELGCLDLLADFQTVFVPVAVWNEVARHRPEALRRRKVRSTRIAVKEEPSRQVAELGNAFSLAAGERESLILMAALPDALLLTDDAAARVVADTLGYEVHGTIGVIVRSIASERRTKRQVLNLLRAIPRRSTLYISRSLLNSVLDHVRTT